MKLFLQIIMFIQLVLIAMLYVQNKSLSANNVKLSNTLTQAQYGKAYKKIVKIHHNEKHNKKINTTEATCNKFNEQAFPTLTIVEDVENYMFYIDQKIDEVAYLVRSDLNNAQTEHDILTLISTLSQLERIDLNISEVTNLLDKSKQFSKVLHREVLNFLEGSLTPHNANDLYPYLESDDLVISNLAFTRLKELDKTELVVGMLDELAFNARHKTVQTQALSYLQYVNDSPKLQLDLN